MTPPSITPREVAAVPGSIPGVGVLLDPKVRRALKLYSSLGYVGFVISEALAYIDLLEEASAS